MMFLFDGAEKILKADFLEFPIYYFLLNILRGKKQVQLKKKEGYENYFQEG